jgi:hypothetical protein
MVVEKASGRVPERAPGSSRSRFDDGGGLQYVSWKSDPSLIGVKMEQIISDRSTDRRITKRKNGFGRIVAGYGHGYG